VEVCALDSEHLDLGRERAERVDEPLWPRPVVAPSGHPKMAREMVLELVVTDPSIVQWPELCTRGANSLATELTVAGRRARR